MMEKAVLHNKHNQQRQQNLQEVLWFQWKQYQSESRDILQIKYMLPSTLLFHMQTEILLMISATHYVHAFPHSKWGKKTGKRKTSWVKTWKILIPVRMVLAPYTTLHWFGCTLTALVCNAKKMWFELSYHIIMPLPWCWLHKWEFMWLNGLFEFI